MGRFRGGRSQDYIATIPLGGFASIIRSGDQYKAVGSVVKRADYPALSAAFPRAGAFTAVQRTMPGSPTWGKIAYGNGVFVAVTYGNSFFISYDGVTWTALASPGGSRNYTCVTFGNGKFVAICQDNLANQVAVSADGVNWALGNMPSIQQWSSVTYGAGLFVAVCSNGSGVAATSPDGVTWTSRAINGAQMVGVVYGNNRFVAMSNGVMVCTSPDGITWTNRGAPNNIYKGIAFGAGLFVTVGEVGAVITSPDGITWTARGVPVATSVNVDTITYGNGVFVASSGSAILVSADGINWVSKDIGIVGGFTTLGYGDGVFVALRSGYSTQLNFYAENLTDSDFIYLPGTAGQFVRVK